MRRLSRCPLLILKVRFLWKAWQGSDTCQKSITEFCYALKQGKRDKRQNQSESEKKKKKQSASFFSHTFFTKFPVSGGSVELTWSSECKRPLEAPSVYFAGHILKASERESSEGDSSGDAVAKTGQKVLRSDSPTFKLLAGSNFIIPSKFAKISYKQFTPSCLKLYILTDLIQHI